jgi:broad specificity phosphatase PhoE
MSVANPTTLYLARHGQSESNNQGLVTGQIDIGLSPKGQDQSRALALCLRDEPLAAIYASALRRTAETAQPTAAAKTMPIVSLPALNEIHMGVLQGRHRDGRDGEAQALWAQWQADLWGFRVPGGEGMGEFASRVESALHELLRRHHGEHVLIVGHRATNRVLLGTLLGWPRERWGEIRLRNKFLYRVEQGEPVRIATFTLSGSKTGQWVDGFIM